MPTSLIDADSFLAIDVGTVSTRAMLFDVVDGRYRYIASGAAETTAGAPYSNIGEGVRRAIDQLQTITGRNLIDADGHLIIPSMDSGAGVDVLVTTLSTGKPLRVVSIGLLEDVSAESAQRLATTTYAQVFDRISLNDRRKGAARLDAILRARPDLIIVAGGTEGGASQSVMGLIESVGLACYLTPAANRPEILYAGNKELIPQVEEAFQAIAPVAVAPNVRPGLDVEQLSPAQNQIANVYRSVRARTIPGVYDLDTWTTGSILPTATAFGRIIRFLSKVDDSVKGVLGIDIGASSLTAAASFSGDLYLGVYTDLGLGERVDNILSQTSYELITRWLPFDLSESTLRDYLYNKKIHPNCIPVTLEELTIEQALAREAMAVGVKRLSRSFPKSNSRSYSSYLPWFEPIVGTGSVLTNAPTRGQSLLMLLDGLQPVGVTTVVLDQNNITPALGAAAPHNSILPIQILETNTFLNLGTVISVVSSAAMGAPVLKARVTYANGNETQVEVKNGFLEAIPLPMGEKAKLQLHPLNRADIGIGGPGRGGTVRVTGGVAGVIIDARGRPLRLPKDHAKRRELLKKWLWSLDG
jgi:hypothetical protein